MKIKVEPLYKFILNRDWEFNGRKYEKGHKFHAIGAHGIRGFDLEDENGNVIYETSMISYMFDRDKSNS